MPCRKSRGGSKGNDWSPYEVAWVNILHREIFEDGTYFDKVNSTKRVKSVKYEDSSDEEATKGAPGDEISTEPHSASQGIHY